MGEGIRLGITGGIGSGKTYVARLFESKFGIPVYNCDKEAKRLNVESAEIRESLTTLIGPEVYAPDGALQRQVLATYLFANETHAKRINAIVHPVVAQDFTEWAKRMIHNLEDTELHIVALESAILFESGFDKLVDVSINISAPRHLCLQRATERDKASAQAIEQRMKQQLSDEERNERADFTIINDGRMLEPQIEEVLRQIRAKATT